MSCKKKKKRRAVVGRSAVEREPGDQRERREGSRGGRGGKTNSK